MKSLTKTTMLFTKCALKLLAALVLATLLTKPEEVASLRLLKDQTHCSTHLFLTTKDNQITRYHVEEFIDGSRNRSSIVLTGGGIPKVARVYFNEYLYSGNAGGMLQIAERRLMVYDLQQSKCRSISLADWPLFPLRRMLVHMLPDIMNVPQLIEEAIGPSSLLLSVEANLKTFLYKARQFSQSRLTFLDVYVRSVDDEGTSPSDEYGGLFVKVMLYRTDRRSPKIDTPLSEIVSASGDSPKSLEIASITVCKLDTQDDSSTATNDSYKQQVDENYDCDREQTLLHADFVFNSQLESRSLIGSSLDSPRGNFYEDPFVPPVGIGCFDGDLRFSELKQFSAPSQRFSAEYTTSNGTRGLSFVAYDGHNSLVRLDRFGRRNIYDLIEEKSYHVAEFHPSSNVSDQISDRARNCIALPTSFEPFANKETAMERLLGVGVGGESPAHYLGSKRVDHMSYDVYERELRFIQGQYNLPILLEPIGYELPTIDLRLGTRFYLTYYVRESEHKLFDKSTGVVKEPHFVELWKLDIVLKRKTLVNRLTFLQFSWELEVTPSESPNEDLSQLFHLAGCLQERGQQMELRFRIVQTEAEHEANNTSGKTNFVALKANTNAIKAKVGEELSELLEIPRLSISHLQLIPRKSGDLLIEARISDLIEGLESQKYLGASSFRDLIKVDKKVLKITKNRHSQLECQLDSLQYFRLNWMVYCKSVAACLLLERDDEVKKHFLVGGLDGASGQDSIAYKEEPLIECSAHEMSWAVKPPTKYETGSEFESKETAVGRLVENQYKMRFFKLEFTYDYYDDRAANWLTYQFQGYSQSAEIRPLNSDGILSSIDSKFALIGLRYMTNREARDTHNMNVRVQLPDSISDAFRHCQLACQLDDYCASFSFCSRPDGTRQENDCVLSTVRLSGKRMRRFALKVNKSPKESEFSMQVTSKLMSQLIKFKRDDRCALHKKDMVSSFKSMPMAHSLIESEFNVLEDKLDKEEKPKQKQKPKRRTLEDCAEECHENALANFLNPFEAAFTYCALDSMCLDNGGDWDNIDGSYELSMKSFDTCFVYRKHHTQYYDSTPLTRMMVKSGDGQKNEAIDLAKGMSPTSDGMNPFNTDYKNTSISRVFKGLNAEECARDCGLLDSKCLSFDSCTFGAKLTLCILFSIRGPNSSISPRVPLLPIERDYYEATNEVPDKNSRVDLVSHSVCQHFDLKDEYFEVRVQQLLDRAAQSDRDPKINQVEDNILINDQKRSDGTQVIDESTHYNKPSAGSSTNWLLLLVGIIFGAFLVQYGQQTSAKLLELYREKRSQYHANQSLGRLTLTNNMEL